MLFKYILLFQSQRLIKMHHNFLYLVYGMNLKKRK
jgi:hypothetical protein